MLKAWTPQLLSIFRIMVGLLFLEHGTSKLLGFPNTGRPVHLDPASLFTTLAGWSGILELVGGLLIVFGLFTRVTAFILSGEMAVAYFLAHNPRGAFPLLNGGEAAVLYCFAFLYLSAAGAGPWSADAIRGSGRPRRRRG